MEDVVGVAQPSEDVLALVGEPGHGAFGIPDRDQSPAQVVVLRIVARGPCDLLFEVDERGVEVTFDRRERLGLGEGLDWSLQVTFQFALGVLARAAVGGAEHIHQSES